MLPGTPRCPAASPIRQRALPSSETSPSASSPAHWHCRRPEPGLWTRFPAAHDHVLPDLLAARIEKLNLESNRPALLVIANGRPDAKHNAQVGIAVEHRGRKALSRQIDDLRNRPGAPPTLNSLLPSAPLSMPQTPAG